MLEPFTYVEIKPDAVHAPLNLLIDANRELKVPIAAIGGITIENAPLLIAAGATALAVISALFEAADVTSAARHFAALFADRR